MEYKKIKPQKLVELTESDFRKIWDDEYCTQQILTFDAIQVKFYSEMFDHCFFESADRKAKDKSILSLNRLEKIYWIKDTLQDPTSLLKQGWDNKNKAHDNARRVAMVKGNYVVVISIYAEKKARFITAFQIENEDNLKNFINGPNWLK